MVCMKRVAWNGVKLPSWIIVPVLPLIKLLNVWVCSLYFHHFIWNPPLMILSEITQTSLLMFCSSFHLTFSLVFFNQLTCDHTGNKLACETEERFMSFNDSQHHHILTASLFTAIWSHVQSLLEWRCSLSRLDCFSLMRAEPDCCKNKNHRNLRAYMCIKLGGGNEWFCTVSNASQLLCWTLIHWKQLTQSREEP